MGIRTIEIEGFRVLKIEKEIQLDSCQHLKLLTIKNVEEIYIQPYSLSHSTCNTGAHVLIENSGNIQLQLRSFVGKNT